MEMLHLWEGIINIYMPDMKYSNADTARKYSGISNYPAHNREAILEMHRQVGNLLINDKGIATSGLLIRHLVLPHDISGTADILKFLAEEVSRDTYISLMSQYFPAFHATKIPILSQPLIRAEYRKAVRQLENLHLEEGWVQT